MLDVSTWLASALLWVLASSLKGTILVGLVLVVRWFLMPATAVPLRYALWLPVLLGLIWPLGLSVQLPGRIPSVRVPSVTLPHDVSASRKHSAPPLQIVAEPLLRADRPSVQSAPPPSAQTPKAQSGTTQWAKASALRWIALGWVSVVFGLGLLYARNLQRYRRIVRRAHAADAAIISVFGRCRGQIGLRRSVRVLESADIDSPSLFGWWRPVIMLPEGVCRRLSTNSLRLVILHELAHVKGNDVLVNWLAALTQMLHWFNPVVWFAMRCVRRDMEHACDARVLAHLSAAEHEEYGRTLVHLAAADTREPVLTYSLGIADRHSDLRQRLIMIARLRPTTNGIKLMVCLALTGYTCLALTQPSLAAYVQDETKPTTSKVADVNSPANALIQAATARHADGVPLEKLVQQVAANIHRRVIVDPRATSTIILYGQNLDQIDYSDFLTILRINGLTAVDVNDYINVVPIVQVRTLPLPAVASGKDLPADQFADMSIVLKNACAPSLIPLLRPWLPFYAYLAADSRSNSILAIDTYANLKRIRGMIVDLDARTPPGTRCRVTPSGSALPSGRHATAQAK
jgi:beta-lactamase regulating signal transducer with metallopeptidase domain